MCSKEEFGEQALFASVRFGGPAVEQTISLDEGLIFVDGALDSFHLGADTAILVLDRPRVSVLPDERRAVALGACGYLLAQSEKTARKNAIAKCFSHLPNWSLLSI